MKNKSIDYKLFLTITVLIIFGVIMISSISVYQSYLTTTKMVNEGKIKEAYNHFYLFRSIGHIVIAFLIIGIFSKINFKFFEKYSKIVFGIGILSLIYVLFFGLELNGATGWIQTHIPGLGTVQPSEFFKPALILFLAYFFRENYSNLADLKKGLIPFLAILGVIVGLLGSQPDFGTILVIFPVAVIMFFYAGGNKKHLLSLFAAGVILIFTVYNLGSYDEEKEKGNMFRYITVRIDNFLKPNEQLMSEWEDSTHQTRQGLITIGSGGFSGKGFGQSIQKFGYLPEVQGDFIFSVIVEELGFRGALILLLVYLYILYRGLYISYNVTDKFAKYVALGIVSRIAWQTFINIGVNLNIVPLTGVTFPFISYGGSSLLSLAIGVGILLSISREVEPKPTYSRMAKQKFIF